MRLILLFAFLGAVITKINGQCLSERDVLERLLNNYDKETPPSNQYPVNVELAIWISDIRIDRDVVEADIFVNEKYNDDRLRFSNMRPCNNLIPIGADQWVTKFWKPKLSAVDARFQKQKGDSATFKQEFLALYENGTVWRNVHINYGLRCTFEPKNFPYDSFTCQLTWESFQYNASRVDLHWGSAPMSLLKKEDINGWKLETSLIEHEKSQPDYPAGKWSENWMKLHFKRNSCWFIYHGFIPAILCVLACWLSMFLPRSAITARAITVMLSLLLLVFLAFYMNQFVVGAKPITKMDIFIGGCAAFAMLALFMLTTVAEGCFCKRKNVTKDGYMAAPDAEDNARSCNALCGVCDWSFRLVYPLLFAVFFVCFLIFA